MVKNILTFIVIFLSFLSFSQPENPTIESIDGKKYYVHIVQGGNTLYGLSKLYQIPAEKILEFNPSIENGLQLGQKLILPFSIEDLKSIEPENKGVFQLHKVEKGDNLYNISKRYSVTMEEIVKLNPGSEVNLSLGQELKLPKKAKLNINNPISNSTTQVSFKDSMLLHTVLPHETMYSISKRFMVSVDDIMAANGMRNNKLRKGDQIKIPTKKETITKIEVRKIEEIDKVEIDEQLVFKTKGEYKIVYFLPFAIDGGPDNLRGISTEFLMGAQLALDSLEKLGLKAKIHILDVANDTVKFRAQLNSKDLKKADLVIGPFNGKNVDIAADWAKQNKVRLISPLFSSTAVLKNNPFVYNAVNSDITLIEGSAKYIAENKTSSQLILIKVDAKDDELYQAFRIKFYSSIPKDSKFKLIECSKADMGNFIKKGANIILIVPTRDKIFATRFINNLDKIASKVGSESITVFGMKDWANNDDIKGLYKNKFTLHYASPYDFNYSNESTKNMLKKYRLKYNSDMSKYAVQGFDVSMYFIQDFFLDKNNTTGVMNKFSLKSVGTNSGYENKSCFILKQENYEMIQVGFVNE
jgi:LysM repeat protein/ABC-type branched-subunit amino acid transport system substrate-binding protein